MNDRIDELVQEVMQLAADPHIEPEAVHTKGLEAKQALWDELDIRQLAINILDGIVPYRAKGLPWAIGWVNPSAPPPGLAAASTAIGVPASRRAAPQPSRSKRVLEIAKSLIDDDDADETVKTDFIASMLQRDGDTTPVRSLTTAIGNILNRSGNWRRVRRGEYEPITAEGVM